MLLIVDEGVVAGVIGQAGDLAAGQRQRRDRDRKHRRLDRVDVGQAFEVARPVGRVPARDVILLGIHHVDVLAAGEFRLDDGMVIAGDQFVGDGLVIELFERVDVLLDDLRMILPADEGERLCRRGGGAAARERGGREGGSALQHASAREEESVERRGHGSGSPWCGFSRHDVRTLKVCLVFFSFSDQKTLEDFPKRQRFRQKR